MTLTTIRERHSTPFDSKIFNSIPGNAKCFCTWVYAPRQSPFGRDRPWGLKFQHNHCVVRHVQEKS